MRRTMRWLFRRRLCFGGLAGALVFFCLSLAPSLLPRGVVLQGLLSGITAAIGYGVGSGVSAAVRNFRSEELPRRTKRIGWWLLAGATVAFVPTFLLLGRSWQNDVTDLMTMGSLSAWDWALILVVSVVTALILLLVARLVRGFARVLIRLIDRLLPCRVR